MTVVDPTLPIADVPLWRVLDAIGNGEVHPHYQPIVCLQTGEVLGVEALARWTVHEGTTLPAMAFVPLLERSRRVTDLTAFMLDRACGDLAGWQQAFPLDADFRVAINVSATELNDRRLTALVDEAITTHRISASSLCLELTETARIENPETAQRVLVQLSRELGVRLAVDDYGTGFADGTYLTRFPFDTVKIDHTFVAGMAHRADHARFVRETIRYAGNRSLGVVAEGVETQRQAHALLSAGCTEGQGFGLGMPCPAEHILDRRFGAATYRAPST